MSALMSASDTPCETVRTMKPSSRGRCFSTIARSRRRSRSPSMRRDTPTRLTQGISTRCRPGSEMREVIRAPLVPSGSLETWTTTSRPSARTSSIWGGEPDRAARAATAAVVVVRVVLVDLGAVVAHVEEAGPLEADVDEGRLHPRKDAGDSTLVDASDHVALVGALDVELHDLVGLAHGNPRLARADVHEDLVSHAKSLRGARARLRPYDLEGRRCRRQAARQARGAP